MADPLGAFCTHDPVSIPGRADGPLAGTTFGAKDVFDVAGARTGFGQPDWLRTHPPAEVTAAAIGSLVEAGATLVGKTVSDELCYSLSGVNHHYGTPVNARDPARAPGGSSSGSAAAVAGNLVDFAIGTDCGGSVRIPASYCGILGIRPTFGRVSLDGCLPFTDSFDVAGWFARDPALFERIGTVLLDARPPDIPQKFRRLLTLADAFGVVGGPVAAEVGRAARRIGGWFESVGAITLGEGPLNEWAHVFSIIQGFEIWSRLGAWVTATHPAFGPGVKARFQRAAAITRDEADAARVRRAAIVARVADRLDAETLVLLPTAPRAAPLKDSASDLMEVTYRNQALALSCIAGLCGRPQINLPIADIDGLPLGMSLLGAPGTDEAMLALTRAIFSK